MMNRLNRRTRAAAFTGAALSLTLLLAACGGEDDTTTGAGQKAAKSTSNSASPDSSAPTGNPAAGPHNSADTMWTTEMIPHHAQAVEMSELFLAKDGTDPDVAQLAEQIKAAQAPEIEQMRGWLAGWGEDVPAADGAMGGMDHDMGSMGSGSGMMSEADLSELEAATGAEADRLFLTQMVAHHRGAVAMSKMVLRAGESRDVAALAQTIIATQESEIVSMTELLAG